LVDVSVFGVAFRNMTEPMNSDVIIGQSKTETRPCRLNTG